MLSRKIKELLRTKAPIIYELLYQIKIRYVYYIIKIRYLYHITLDRENYAAYMQNISKRCEATQEMPTSDPITAKFLTDPPHIDISVVTYNSSKWVDAFINSLANINYPLTKISIHFVDSNSTDDTVQQLKICSQTLMDVGAKVNIIQSPSNKGFGACNNLGMQAGQSEFCLITNIDLTFEVNALIHIVSNACADVPNIAAWELRQKPYEHPKFYDPVTGITDWNSHACVLIRRSAFENVGGYDETIFMYGEDVELSYKFRHKGYLLRYNPMAVVYHHTYSSSKTKPLQYTGSMFANFYIRLKYGKIFNILAIPFMMSGLLIRPEAFKGARRHLFLNFIRLIKLTPRTLINRSASNTSHSFYTFDYSLRREGAFIEGCELEKNPPLVSIITRTYQGRDLLLRQALLSVAHQTYPSIEHIIVQDGGNSMRSTVESISKLTNKNMQFIELEKCGRSATGNAGLAAAKGKWCVFLDDDDLLFCDHIETLVSAITKAPGAVASYSLALEIPTSFVSENEVITGYAEIIPNVPSSLKQPFSRKLLLDHNYLPIQSVLFEHNLYKTRGGFDEDLDALEDRLLWNCYAENNIFIYVEKCTSMFRTPTDFKKIKKRNMAFKATYPIVQKRIKLLHNALVPLKKVPHD